MIDPFAGAGAHPLDLDDHLWFEDPRPCWNCGAATNYVEVHFEAPLCPGICTDTKWTQYLYATGIASAHG